MSQVDSLETADVAFICTRIGRGHPFYLNGISRVIDRDFPSLRYFYSDVFAMSQGLPLMAWRLVRQLYHIGARGGIVSTAYGRLRSLLGATPEPGVLSQILGADIRRRLLAFHGPVVVSHPLLAVILSGQNRVIYQHGELAVPAEALVRGCAQILVPTETAQHAFRQAGFPPDTIAVTGQCVESSLCENSALVYQSRLIRIAGEAPLHVGLFSSGAYPRAHLKKLVIITASLIRAGHRVTLFLGTSEKIVAWCKRECEKQGITHETGSRCELVWSPGERAFEQMTVDRFAQLDLFVAPAHERTNWGVGLGIPHFILCPHIGTFAPLNADIALKAGVAKEIGTDNNATEFAEMLIRLRADGSLLHMAEFGWGRNRLDGFEQSARIVAEFASGHDRAE